MTQRKRRAERLEAELKANLGKRKDRARALAAKSASGPRDSVARPPGEDVSRGSTNRGKAEG